MGKTWTWCYCSVTVLIWAIAGEELLNGELPAGTGVGTVAQTLIGARHINEHGIQALKCTDGV